MSFAPADTFAYVSTNYNPSNVSVGAVDAATGNLTTVPGSPFSSAGLAKVEPSQGKYLFGLVGNGVGSYLIDPVTGVPAQAPAGTVSFDPSSYLSPVPSGSAIIVVQASK